MAGLSELEQDLQRAAQLAWDELSHDLRARLLDEARGQRAAALSRLAEHARHAAQADARLAAAGHAPLPADDPAGRVLEHLCPAAAAALASEDPGASGSSPWTARSQKRRGGVYTERPLVDLLLDLAGYHGQERVLEPAVGAGAFLLRAWERARAAGVAPARLAERLRGVDVHPYALREARCALRLLAGEAAPRLVEADALADAETCPAGEWDLVVGNPPYVRGERIPAELRARYRARFPDLGAGNQDLAGYFVAAGLEWLREGGRLAFVLSQGLLEARSTRGLRELLGAHQLEALVSLEWAPGAFPDASVIPLLLVVRKGPPPAGHRVRLGRATWGPGREALEVSWSQLEQGRFLRLAPEGRWPLFLRRGDASLLEGLRRLPTPLEAGYGLAIRTRVGAGELVAEGPEPPASFSAPRPLRDGRDVAAWGTEPVRRWIDYRPEAISDAKSEDFFAGPKLLIPRIALTPQVAVDESDALCRNTVMVARPPAGRDLYATAALLNSLPLRVYAFHLLRAGVLAGSHRCTFYARVLQALPLPTLDEGDEAELARLGREATRLARDPARREQLVELERALDERAALAYGLSASQLRRLRREAGRDPLATVLRPARLGQRRRRIGVAEFAAGARYR